MGSEAVAALAHVAGVIGAQSGEMVSVEVSEAMQEAAELASGSSAIQTSAARRSVANALRALASWLWEATRDAAGKAKEKVAEQTGTWVAAFLTAGASAALSQLSSAYPALFSGAVTAILLRSLTEKKNM